MASGLTFFPHPLTPPTTEEDRLAWLRLIRSPRVGVGTFFRLMAAHGGAQAALAALPGIAGAAGVAAYEPCPADRAGAELERGRREGARLLFWGEADYPAGLTTIADAPPLLWALGDPALLSRPLVALVGARNASSLGLRMAGRLAADLGEAGAVVVSGLARGIDAAAHAGALATGTIAVQGGGIEVLYPAENADLARRIGAQGLRLSEQPPGMEPMARHFPLRNRIIAGLARAVVVVEAAARSGSLMTARLAVDYGREVMAVPGHPFDARASGCNLLIRDGAVLVRGAEDVLAALPTVPAPPTVAGAPVPSAEAGARSAEPSALPRREAGRALPTSRSETDPVRPAGARAPRGSNGFHDQGSGHGAQAARVDAGPLPPHDGRADPGRAEAGEDPDTPDLARRILDRLGPSPLSEDALIRDLALPVAAVAPEILALELDGQIHRHPGGLLSLAV